MSSQKSEKKKKKDRCWEGYKPVPGKKPYSEDSCERDTSSKKSLAVKQSIDVGPGTTIGSLVGAALAGKGNRLEGAGRGAMRGTGVDVGADIGARLGGIGGAVAGGTAGVGSSLLLALISRMRGRQPMPGETLGNSVLLGTGGALLGGVTGSLLGRVGGGIVGYRAAGKILPQKAEGENVAASNSGSSGGESSKDTDLQKESLLGAGTIIGSLAGGALGGKGHRLEGAGRGAVRGAGVDIGSAIGGAAGGLGGAGLGAAAGSGTALLLATIARMQGKEVNPAALAASVGALGGGGAALGGLAGGLLGSVGGGVAGYRSAGKVLGPSSKEKEKEELSKDAAFGVTKALLGILRNTPKVQRLRLPFIRGAERRAIADSIITAKTPKLLRQRKEFMTQELPEAVRQHVDSVFDLGRTTIGVNKRRLAKQYKPLAKQQEATKKLLQKARHNQAVWKSHKPQRSLLDKLMGKKDKAYRDWSYAMDARNTRVDDMNKAYRQIRDAAKAVRKDYNREAAKTWAARAGVGTSGYLGYETGQALRGQDLPQKKSAGELTPSEVEKALPILKRAAAERDSIANWADHLLLEREAAIGAALPGVLKQIAE